jgi:hypothetical protein
MMFRASVAACCLLSLLFAAIAACDSPQEPPGPKVARIDGAFGLKFGQDVDPTNIIERNGVSMRLRVPIPHRLFVHYYVEVTEGNRVQHISASGSPPSYDQCLSDAEGIASIYSRKYAVTLESKPGVFTDPLSGPVFKRTDWTRRKEDTSFDASVPIYISISCSLVKDISLVLGKEERPPITRIHMSLTDSNVAVIEASEKSRKEKDAF